jgi:hypothetical protein
MNNFLLAVLNFYDVEMPDFYKLSEEFADLKAEFLDDEVWS